MNLTVYLTVVADFSVLHSSKIQILTAPVNHRVGVSDTLAIAELGALSTGSIASITRHHPARGGIDPCRRFRLQRDMGDGKIMRQLARNLVQKTVAGMSCWHDLVVLKDQMCTSWTLAITGRDLSHATTFVRSMDEGTPSNEWPRLERRSPKAVQAISRLTRMATAGSSQAQPSLSEGLQPLRRRLQRPRPCGERRPRHSSRCAGWCEIAVPLLC